MCIRDSNRVDDGWISVHIHDTDSDKCSDYFHILDIMGAHIHPIKPIRSQKVHIYINIIVCRIMWVESTLQLSPFYRYRASLSMQYHGWHYYKLLFLRYRVLLEQSSHLFSTRKCIGPPSPKMIESVNY